MKTCSRFEIGMVLAVAAPLVVGGVATSFAELNVFSAGSPTVEGRFAALEAGSYRAGPSILSKQLLLETCNEAIAGVYGRLQPTQERTIVLDRCRSYADGVVDQSPSLSFGWYVGALAAASLGDMAGFNARILRSQRTGPSEQWVAELRVRLVETNFGSADQAVLDRHAQDLRLLVRSPRGIASIAQRYVGDPSFRERVTQIVETMSETDQRRFVDTVRRAAAGAA